MRAIFAVLVAVLALAGCGSKSNSGGDGGANSSNNKGAAYDAAFDICSGGTKATADAYAVEPTAAAVTDLVVEQVSGGSAQDEAAARQGCTDALKKADAG